MPIVNAYNIDWWGAKYFAINEEGHIIVRPNALNPDAIVDLAKLVKERAKQGQRLPALMMNMVTQEIIF